MTTRQTPDAVREATMVLDVFLAAYARRSDDMPVYLDSDDDNLLRWGHLRTILAALDSRAGDAGEGKAYRCRGCGWRGSEPIANGHPQNGCDLELMVHDPIATTAPAVDAVPAGEVPDDAEIIKFANRFYDPADSSYGADTRKWIKAVRAALSHGEGR